jgi:hypothetical protein
MKPPPTLADACIATALDKRFSRGGKRSEDFCGVLKRILTARKFVLDINMSAYLAELSVAFWNGGLRKRNCMLDNVRQHARLPHPTTWIEIDFINGYMPRAKALGNLKVVANDHIEPAKYGWLLRQHPKVETSFICTEIRSCTGSDFSGTVMVHPMSMAWSVTNDPSAWRRFDVPTQAPRATSEWIVGIEGYVNEHTHWASSFDTDDTALDMFQAMEPPPGKRQPGWEMFILPRLHMRDVWALLATVNDLPILIEHVEPSHGYVARGSYKKFLKHSVVHLTVPETRWRKLVIKTSVILRKRAHQVRGHWRKDWRNPLTPLCDHEFNDAMICTKCKGHKIWIIEHQRGDAGLGFVTHDYEVHHDEAIAS